MDYYRGRLSARRLRVLIEHLPRESALAKAVLGEQAQWGLAEHLAATVADHLAIGNWMFATVNTAEHADPPPRPEPLPRPGDDAEDDLPAATRADIAAFLGGGGGPGPTA